MPVNLAPTGPHLLDTSAVIIMMRRGSVASSKALNPFVTLGELLTGAERVNNSDREQTRIQAVIGHAPVIYPTNQTVNVYARIAAELQRMGRPIPTKDRWNAALALEWNLGLLTDDMHFARVPDLKVIPIR